MGMGVGIEASVSQDGGGGLGIPALMVVVPKITKNLKREVPLIFC